MGRRTALASRSLWSRHSGQTQSDASRRLHAEDLKRRRLNRSKTPVIAWGQIAFRVIVNVTIVANAIQMGVAADITTSEMQDVWLACNHVFAAVFVLEMIFMIAELGCSYFKDTWLLFDGFVAITSAFDCWVLPFVPQNDNTGFLLQFRLLRLLRIAKVTRIFPDLAVVFEALINSMKSMFWIFVLLFVILYAGAICCVHVLGRSDSGYAGYHEDQHVISLEILENWNNYAFFGTVYRAMLTLFGMVLLSEWPVIRKVHEVHLFMVPLFALLVILVAFGVLNVIIGIVVEKTTTAMNAWSAEKEQSLQQERADLALRLKEILFRFDSDGDRRLELEELQSSVDHADFKELLIKLNLPHNFSTVEFFRMLDTNGSGKLSEDEFVDGILRLVYSTDFQCQCALSASLGMLHSEMKRLQIAMIHEIATVRDTLIVQSSENPARIDTRDSIESLRTVGINLNPTVSAPFPDLKTNATSFSGDQCNSAGFEMDAPDEHPASPYRSWNPERGDIFLLSSAGPTPLSSEAEHEGGDGSMNTYWAKWEPLETPSIVPIRMDHATGHMISGSGTNTAKFKDLQLLGYVPLIGVRQTGLDCQGNATHKAPSPRTSNEDRQRTLKRLYKV